MADDKDIAGEESPPGGRKKLIIIVAAVALVLLLGAAAAAFFLSADSEPADAAGDGETAEQQEVAIADGDPMYFKLEPVFIVNLPPGGPAGMLQVAIEVLTLDPSVGETLQANDPMIRHHLLNLLEQQQGESLLSVAGKQALQQQIQDLLAEKLGELGEQGSIRGVYFTQFVMQ